MIKKWFLGVKENPIPGNLKMHGSEDEERLGDLPGVKKKRRLTVGAFEKIVNQLETGIKTLHDLGFIHTDIKPANLFLRFDGQEWQAVVGDLVCTFFVILM